YQNGSVVDLRRWYWVTINRCLGCYWKLLFCLLEALQAIKERFLGSMPLSFIGRLFRKVVAVAIKLPTRLFR
ncbi:MAG: hypothetical protein GY868_04655, partial [Deltaproteobacteria bacterium]|nr:hypothetical protein [Deltaproteobacteria bacterium]